MNKLLGFFRRIMDFLSNPWVIGIGGGVLSGLLVTLITRYLFSKRERREYLQKVATANNEIIYAIRPAIAEKVIPSNEMLDALFSATARKYSVDRSDLYGRMSLVNELIKEVMDNTFLSSQQKMEFCDLLSTLKRDKSDAPEVKKVVEYIRVNRESGVDTSVMLGMVTATMALVTTFYIYFRDKDEFISEGLSGISTKILPMMLVMTIVPVMAVFMKDVLRKLRKLEQERTKLKQGFVSENKEGETE